MITSQSFKEAKFRKNKIYWYGHKGSTILEKLPLSTGDSDIPMICLSKDKSYAIQYTEIDDVPSGYLYKVQLDKDFNLLNLHYQKDFDIFSKSLPNLSIDQLKLLKTNDWLDYHTKFNGLNIDQVISKRNDLINTVHELGFEGFFNYESDNPKFPSICLFDNKNISILEAYDKNDIQSFKNEQSQKLNEIKELSKLDDEILLRSHKLLGVKLFRNGFYVPLLDN